jgi:GT2 family glycosyltransferase
MALTSSTQPRVVLDGKSFRLGDAKFHVKGVTYGPFAPNPAKERFPTPELADRDLRLARALGANVLRVYHLPPPWFLRLAEAHGLKLWVDFPWNKHLCFLDSAATQAETIALVREAARVCCAQSAVFALSVANEIPPDIVRWSSRRAVERFIDKLVHAAKSVDPELLCTMANFPPTEFLRPRSLDFLSFNVYLHEPEQLANYIARLHMQADGKPVVLSECGADGLREGEQRQAELVAAQIETGFRSGLAGVIVFSFTDDWHKDGRAVADWAMGLTRADRQLKPAFDSVRQAFAIAPHVPLPRWPKVSVVVASYNEARTLAACLNSLDQLRYPDYEVLLVDDGSTDQTAQIASRHARVRYLRFATNQGLSSARNTGIRAAAGDVIAFTDADCRADPDWLHHLITLLVSGPYVGVGGHNLLPPDDSCTAAAVMASPGGPAHVMLTDRTAEHIPGCNMAFYKWALDEIGGFDPVFRRAGDDVDVCWRLQQQRHALGFAPAAFVWHYRRSTIREYLIQQWGYGQAEALLVRKHPEYFNAIGGSLWRGRIYGPAQPGVRWRAPMVYHGPFGSGWFQSLYATPPAGALAVFTSLEYHVLVTLPLLVLSTTFPPLAILGVTSVLLTLGVCVAAAWQAEVPLRNRRFWMRPLVVLLFLLQPLVRGTARYHGRLVLRSTPAPPVQELEALHRKYQGLRSGETRYWAERPIDRIVWLGSVLRRLDRDGWPNRPDTGWSRFDIEVFGNWWSRVQLTTVSEYHAGGRQLIRCRLKGAWSLASQLLFWGACGVELFLLGLLARGAPWYWLVLLTLPLLVLWIRAQKHDLQCRLAVVLDGVADESGLVKLEAAPPPPPVPAPASAAASSPLPQHPYLPQ